MAPFLPSLKDAIDRRIPGKHPTAEKWRSAVLAACEKALDAGLMDKGALSRLCGTDDGLYWGAMSEILLADRLLYAGLQPTHQEPGPDFRLDHVGKTIWVEVVTPLPTGIPAEWLQHEPGNAVYFPGEAMLLRWTAAIKEKAEKLRGNSALGKLGYLGSGIVHADDAYVIAVNGLLLRGGGFGRGDGFPQLEGISQFPLAVEATYAVGPYSITINRETLEKVSAGLSHRPRLKRPKGADVPADTFHDPNFGPISAVWAVDIGYGSTLHTLQPMAVVHNPHARNSIPFGLLPAHEEFTLELTDDEMAVKRHAGREFVEAV
ncbi:hypothetical protein [Rhizobium sp. CIAT894]|uniref:hypothetical protein n=1 Tax=Rhizobium sp. CIAT894 TaxID=2020312 RepID=UPI000F73EB90|nr:hypothetical protein [Rhizobium sp. CIAT894]